MLSVSVKMILFTLYVLFYVELEDHTKNIIFSINTLKHFNAHVKDIDMFSE